MELALLTLWAQQNEQELGGNRHLTGTGNNEIRKIKIGWVEVRDFYTVLNKRSPVS